MIAPANDGPASQETRNHAVETASAWVLRLGVIAAAAIIVIGLALSGLHRNLGLVRLQHQGFDRSPAAMFEGAVNLRGQAFIELGICLLAVTPIMRVAASCALFLLVERDRLYAAITFVVLLLTLTGLALLK